jgi:Predicted Zn-dependent peptidases
MYKKTILDNGLRVITNEIPYFKTATIGIWVDTGSINESSKNNGISHFIEHMLFKGTETRSASDISELVDSIGGSINAFTTKEHTCFHIKVLDKYVDMSLELLFDMLKNSKIDLEDLEKERKVILDEIRLRNDNPNNILFNMFDKIIWKNNSLSRDVIGTKKSVGSITRDDILEYMKKYYTPDNIVVAISGNVNHDEVAELCSKYSNGLNKNILRKRKLITDINKEVKFKSKYKNCDQVYVVFGKESGISILDDDKIYTSFLIDTILGSCSSSRLYREIREKRGLAYSINSFADNYLECGMFGIYVATSPNQVNEVYNLIIEVTEDMRKNSVTVKELERAKEQYKCDQYFGLENSYNLMYQLAYSELYKNRFINTDEKIRMIDKITLDDVSLLCDRLLGMSAYSTVVLGKIKQK